MWKVIRQSETLKIPGHGKTLNSEVGKDGGKFEISRLATYLKSTNRVDFVAGSVKSQSLASPVAHLPTHE